MTCPTLPPARTSKLDGSPATWTIAWTSFNLGSLVAESQRFESGGSLLGHARTRKPPGVEIGSATIAPPTGWMAVCVPVVLSKTTPSCRLFSPVATGTLPALKVPLGESDARHRAIALTPSAAFITGSSTGHRLNGPQSPLSVGNDGGDVPVAAEVGLAATRTANAASAPTIPMPALPAIRSDTRDSLIERLPSPPSVRVRCYDTDMSVPSPSIGGTPVNAFSRERCS